jgi:hypothetical protein
MRNEAKSGPVKGRPRLSIRNVNGNLQLPGTRTRRAARATPNRTAPHRRARGHEMSSAAPRGLTSRTDVEPHRFGKKEETCPHPRADHSGLASSAPSHTTCGAGEIGFGRSRTAATRRC